MPIFDYKRYIELAEEVFSIHESKASAEMKYDLIFKRGYCDELNNLMPLEYFDPDDTYEEDVQAYVNALWDRLVDIKAAYKLRP